MVTSGIHACVAEVKSQTSVNEFLRKAIRRLLTFAFQRLAGSIEEDGVSAGEVLLGDMGEEVLIDFQSKLLSMLVLPATKRCVMDNGQVFII